MASRSSVTPGIIVAQLDGRARYLLSDQVPRHEAIEDPREIDGASFELIERAAASAQSAYDRDTARGYQGDRSPSSRGTCWSLAATPADTLGSVGLDNPIFS